MRWVGWVPEGFLGEQNLVGGGVLADRQELSSVFWLVKIIPGQWSFLGQF